MYVTKLFLFSWRPTSKFSSSLSGAALSRLDRSAAIKYCMPQYWKALVLTVSFMSGVVQQEQRDACWCSCDFSYICLSSRPSTGYCSTVEIFCQFFREVTPFSFRRFQETWCLYLHDPAVFVTLLGTEDKKMSSSATSITNY